MKPISPARLLLDVLLGLFHAASFLALCWWSYQNLVAHPSESFAVRKAAFAVPVAYVFVTSVFATLLGRRLERERARRAELLASSAASLPGSPRGG
jgi:ABC-type uncharacterized transport system fused permease/ATPase subunit